MQDLAAEKWILDVSPGELPRDVAVRTLRGRLDAVLHYLPLAAEKADQDIEHVHQLRVWSRRASAALSLYKDLLPQRRYSRLKKQLRQIRRAANDARDCDVIILRLRARRSDSGVKRWLKCVLTEREDAQSDLVTVIERLQRRDRFARQIEELLQRVSCRVQHSGPAEDTCFGDWASEQLGRAAGKFFEALPLEGSDEAKLHFFRIRGKKLRYVMELLAGVFPASLRTSLYPEIEKMQEMLGEINDLATATVRLRRKVKRARRSTDAARWRALLISERAQVADACSKFWEYCTLKLLQELRSAFGTLLRASLGHMAFESRGHSELPINVCCHSGVTEKVISP